MIAATRLNIFETIEVVQHDLDFEPHFECQATGAPPGSMEKIQVMCERLAKGQEMHHPNDAKTCASVELQCEMSEAVIVLGKMHREACRVKRLLKKRA
jgi:hypothetical protein